MFTRRFLVFVCKRLFTLVLFTNICSVFSLFACLFVYFYHRRLSIIIHQIFLKNIYSTQVFFIYKKNICKDNGERPHTLRWIFDGLGVRWGAFLLSSFNLLFRGRTASIVVRVRGLYLRPRFIADCADWLFILSFFNLFVYTQIQLHHHGIKRYSP